MIISNSVVVNMMLSLKEPLVCKTQIRSPLKSWWGQVFDLIRTLDYSRRFKTSNVLQNHQNNRIGQLPNPKIPIMKVMLWFFLRESNLKLAVHWYIYYFCELP